MSDHDCRTCRHRTEVVKEPVDDPDVDFGRHIIHGCRFPAHRTILGVDWVNKHESTDRIANLGGCADWQREPKKKKKESK